MSQEDVDPADLTRKQRREQARTERKALEEAEAANAIRRKRLTLLGTVVAVVVAAIVVILVATGGSSGKKTISVGSTESTEALAAVESTLKGTVQHANVLGNPNAPVTLQYFGDLECPVCKEFTLGALPQIIQKWVVPGKLKIEYRSLETATREPEVFKTQQVAALATGKQNLMWWYVELFYHEQGEEDSGYVNEAYLDGIAKQVPGLNLTKWTSDRSDPSLAKQVENDATVASNEGFNGTPSFLLGKTGGASEKITEDTTASLTEASAVFDPAIEKLLKS